ncbi:MAG: 6-hydroxymethylpterin diphosphokinase MptE-like protein [Thermoplasmata archaeon]
MYREICREFGYDEEADAKSADLLASILSHRAVPTVQDLMSSCPESVTICGDGPSLRGALSRQPPEGYVVAADGATTALLEVGLMPDAIVTDMDGAVEDQLRASAEGSLVFAHAHGDNEPAVRTVVPRFEGPVVGTCQGPPSGGLMNLGGFTDGDRAACIFSGLGAERVVLVGFDFDRPSPKASRSPDVKARKLKWAKRILACLAEQGVTVDGL